MTFQPNFNIKTLLEAGVHFGHRKNMWNPQMEEYIYGMKNKTHIIDLRKTAPLLFNALKVIYSIASQNGRILFVNTKKQSTDIIKEAASRCGQYYVNYRWLGGMLTNWSTVSSSIKTLKGYEKILEEEGSYTKKELLQFSRKKEKLEKAIGGIRDLGGTPNVLFIIDVKTHVIAVQEAKKLNIPIIAVVDTNSTPEGIDYVIPGNDDGRKAIELYCNLVADATLAGMQESLASSGVDLKTKGKQMENGTEKLKKGDIVNTDKKGKESMSINTNMIKELRNRTGAAILDCKKALEETNANLEEAITWLRKKGLASAVKKAEREAKEGVIATFIDGNKATIIELSSETDFVGKNEKFLGLADAVVKGAHNFEGDSLSQFLESGTHNTTPIKDTIAEHISVIGENILLKRLAKINVQNGKMIAYIHNKLTSNIGKTGVVVALEGEINNEVEEFGKQLAMHIAASRPIALNQESLDPKIIEKEKSILKEQALKSGKPVEVVDKMIEGRIRKFLEEVVLLEQSFVVDGKTKIKSVIEDLKNKANCKFAISGYIRYEIGENQ